MIKNQNLREDSFEHNAQRSDTTKTERSAIRTAADPIDIDVVPPHRLSLCRQLKAKSPAPTMTEIAIAIPRSLALIELNVGESAAGTPFPTPSMQGSSQMQAQAV